MHGWLVLASSVKARFETGWSPPDSVATKEKLSQELQVTEELRPCQSFTCEQGALPQKSKGFKAWLPHESKNPNSRVEPWPYCTGQLKQTCSTIIWLLCSKALGRHESKTLKCLQRSTVPRTKFFEGGVVLQIMSLDADIDLMCLLTCISHVRSWNTFVFFVFWRKDIVANHNMVVRSCLKHSVCHSSHTLCLSQALVTAYWWLWRSIGIAFFLDALRQYKWVQFLWVKDRFTLVASSDVFDSKLQRPSHHVLNCIKQSHPESKLVADELVRVASFLFVLILWSCCKLTCGREQTDIVSRLQSQGRVAALFFVALNRWSPSVKTPGLAIVGYSWKYVSWAKPDWSQ